MWWACETLCSIVAANIIQIQFEQFDEFQYRLWCGWCQWQSYSYRTPSSHIGLWAMRVFQLWHAFLIKYQFAIQNLQDLFCVDRSSGNNLIFLILCENLHWSAPHENWPNDCQIIASWIHLTAKLLGNHTIEHYAMIFCVLVTVNDFFSVDRCHWHKYTLT